MDKIVEGTPKFDHCVDDSILWNDTIESNFFQVCDFLEKCSKAGCTFNPEKFQFASDEVNFLGFKITREGLDPTDEFVNNIKSFPTPKNLTDVRAWFGTINQISYTFAIAEQMAPFRTLLSSKLPFMWSPELDQAFQQSKMEIIRQCSAGVRKFDQTRHTALATDWSRMAVGCWLTQKFCECTGNVPGCCATGWQTIHVASKFNSPTVAGYHPIEGEAYAAAWALQKCKLFVLGNPRLTLAVDHKPLLAILGNSQDLTDVLNPRLLNFKLKSMAYSFTPVHIPGKKHVVPDSFSRRNDSPVSDLKKPPKLPPITNNVLPEYGDSFGPPDWVSQPQTAATSLEDSSEELYIAQTLASVSAIASTDPAAGQSLITWEKLQDVCLHCPDYKQLHSVVVANDVSLLGSKLSDYSKIFQELTTLGPIVMLHRRIVVPKELQATVLSHLHSSHAGINIMMSRACRSVYWPKYKLDIEAVRQKCQSCHENAPSNKQLPLNPEPDMPQL